MKISATAINGLSLAAIQGANALFPLLIFPFLLGKLGTDAFTALVVAEALALYVLAVCLYSFDTTGVHSIIEAKSGKIKDADKICFFNILGARLGLFTLASIIVLALYEIFGEGSIEVLLAWLVFTFGMILQCNYYFQAIEKNWPLAIFVLISRLIAVAAIYYYIDGAEDLLVASIILAGSYLISGIAAIMLLCIHFKEIGLKRMQLPIMISMVIEERHLFFGNISVALFRSSNVLILAGVSNSAAVAAYAMAEKTIKSLQALARPLNQHFATRAMKSWAVYPHEKKTQVNAFDLIWKKTRIQVYVMSLITPISIALIYAGAVWGVMPGYTLDTLILIGLMSPAILFGVANAMFGVVGLKLLGAQSYFATAVIWVGVITFLYSIAASYFFNAIGSATAYLFAECMLLIAFVIRYYKKNKYV